MIEQVTYLGVLLAGIISFLSPCVLPLVPPYFCYMGGVSLNELEDTTQSDASVRRRVLINALLFVIGFSVVFVTLGATATGISKILHYYTPTLSIIAGVLIIIMGLHFLGLFKIGLLYREFRFKMQGQGAEREDNKALGFVASFVMGLAFAFGWTACLGPILGGVLVIAGSKESVYDGIALLSVYSLGLGVPFLISALFFQFFMGFLRKFRGYLGMVEKVMGAFLVLTGILFLTGGMQAMSYWLLETFPALQSIG